jgi:hypothetical protein
VPAWARERYLKPFGARDYFDDAGGDHHLFSLVLGLDGKSMSRKGIMYWSDGFDKLGDHLYRSFTVVETKEHSGWGNIPIFSGFDPEQGGGPWCWCPIGPAEVVTGGGMPGNWHVSTFVVWQAVKRDGTDGGSSDAVRQAAWHKLGAGYVADSAFVRYARQHGLGIPVTEEFDHAGLRVQGFVSGIVMAPAGRWDQISHLPW